MNIWMIMLMGGLITFAFRFSLIYLFGRFEIPDTIRRALRFVPLAVLSAIIFPELLIQAGAFRFSLDNDRLIAGLISILAAWLTRNTLITIVLGMAALTILQILG